jgi:ABC-type glycerol-3-phosphate transport system substrate-binding protein
MKKNIVLILALLIVTSLLLAACQPQEVVVTQIVEVEKEVVVTVEVEKLEPTPIPEGAIQINFWNVLGGWRAPILEGLVTDFNLQHPGIAIVNEFKGSYRELIQAAIQSTAAGEPPHISQIFEAGTQLALDTEIWMPAEEAVAQCGLGSGLGQVPGCASELLHHRWQTLLFPLEHF